jgi:hypothetical protein
VSQFGSRVPIRSHTLGHTSVWPLGLSARKTDKSSISILFRFLQRKKNRSHFLFLDFQVLDRAAHALLTRSACKSGSGTYACISMHLCFLAAFIDDLQQSLTPSLPACPPSSLCPWHLLIVVSRIFSRRCSTTVHSRSGTSYPTSRRLR